MQVLPSPLKYSSNPHNYVRNGAVPEDEFPQADGTSGPRNFAYDIDELLRVERPHLIDDSLFLPFLGRQPEHDPTLALGDGTVRLHPVEMVLDLDVLTSMVEHARRVCGVDATTGLRMPNKAELRETGGLLAGRLKHDRNNRVWVHVTHSSHSNPEVVGERDMVTFDLDAQGRWLTEIREMGLIDLGFWHSHPTYKPFQSDERFSFGADVQSTWKTCRNWWNVAVVIDPFPTPVQFGHDAVELGCYKLVNPSLPLDDLDPEKGWTMGWRSASILVPKARPQEDAA